MRIAANYKPAEVLPQEGALLQGRSPSERRRRLVQEALELLRQTCLPAGAAEDVSVREFSRVFRGEGLNERPNPLERIFPRAEALALFAVTVGGGVSRRISELFAGDEFPLGYALDAAASMAAERCAELLMLRWREARGRLPGRAPAMRYSPGYCGWHLSGQRALFAGLKPAEAGIALSRDFLMEPLKSVSGVFVCADPAIHRFAPAFPFCRGCRHRTCLERMKGCEGNSAPPTENSIMSHNRT